MINQSVQQKQKRLMMVGLVVFSVLVLSITFYLMRDEVGRRTSTMIRERKVDLPGDRSDVQGLWMNQMEGERQILSKRLEYLEELVIQSKKHEEAIDRENEALKRQVSGLKRDLEAQSVQREMEKVKAAPLLQSAFDDTQVVEEPLFVGSLSVSVMDELPSDKVLHVSSSIPAGTTVKALLVSSLDAPTGVNSLADPQPVKLRVLDDGHLPKEVKALFKGTIFIGSAYGDLSSERVYMRVERMSQVKNNGDFLETEVVGFVSGEDGKYGVRGVVVDRSDKMVKSAAVSGFFSGMSNVLSGLSDPLISCGFGEKRADDWRVGALQEGGLRGGTDALDRLSEYYIRRAEQLAPVVQVASGRVVDVTFTHGVDLGDLHTKEKVAKVREDSRRSEKKTLGGI